MAGVNLRDRRQKVVLEGEASACAPVRSGVPQNNVSVPTSVSDLR